MKSLRFSRTSAFTCMALLVLLSIGIRFHLYTLGAKLIPVTSDEAITVLQAVDIRNGQLPLLMASQPYLFPMEAYWMAPVVHMLPRTPLGMRSLVFLEGLVFAGLSILLLKKMGPLRLVWPGYLLIFFPSSYILMNQTAYSLPGYNSAFLLSLFSAWLVFRSHDESRSREAVIAGIAALSATLAFTNGMFALSFIVPLLVLFVLRSTGRGRWFRLAGAAVGGLIGLLPYIAARLLHPGSYDAVTQRFSFLEAASRLWSPAIVHTLPVTFGWKPCYFPDNAEVIYWGVWGYRIFPFFFVLLLGTGIGCSVFHAIKARRMRTTWKPGILEWAWAAMLICLLIFIFSRRADAASYRYLSPIAVMFPFLAAGLLLQGGRHIRSAIIAVILIITSYNAITSIRITREWRLSYFGTMVMSAPDLKPALDYLREQGIRHAVASYWAAYRIGFESGGDIVCSQPVNERFPGWPLPYKAEVDASTNVAYVLTDKIRHLKPAIFERHLTTMGVEATVHTAGHFIVYHDFRAPGYGRPNPISFTNLTVSSSEPAQLLDRVHDRDPATYWRSSDMQHTNLWLAFDFSQPIRLTRMVVHYGDHEHDRAPAVSISVKPGSVWRESNNIITAELDKFAWEKGHPVYGKAQQTILLDSQRVMGIRIHVAKPNPDRHWTVADIEFFEAPAEVTN